MTERTEGDYGDHHLQVFTSICLLLAIRFVMCQGERIDKTRGMTQKSYNYILIPSPSSYPRAPLTRGAVNRGKQDDDKVRVMGKHATMHYTTTHATHKANMCRSCESCIKYIQKICQNSRKKFKSALAVPNRIETLFNRE